MILQPADGGAARAFVDDRLGAAFGAGDIYAPVFIGDNSRVWLPRAYKPDRPMALLDLSAGKILATVDDARYRLICAARADGTLFVSSGDRGGPQAVFTPGAPDDRQPLETQVTPVRGPTTAIAPVATSRVTDKRIEAQLPAEAGTPVLADQNGNCWLRKRDTNWGSAGVFNLWRDGRIASSVEVPGAGPQPRLFADRPGSVWIWTDQGLQHFRASDPAKPWAYAYHKTFLPLALDRRAASVSFSPGGLVQFTVERETDSVRTFHLPTE
jgi:hypothetical protein